MDVQLHTTEKNGYFYIEVDGVMQAQMTFVFAGPERIIIDHTEVQPGNEGKGYGKKMVSAAVDYAREKHIKIIPLCPFAKSVFDRVPEFRDVL
ncbi:MAG TPA: GNAT family N-acetyltransferase [Haliscomenobacter sp.]|uniref:GNAT family N-acetyltransferase n=1 Tax=Haliscomenobacter sp. TaxID=2717303 RepID=UPI001DEC04AE|nr:GNAT family N-acetyltransferase [Haliscomenobacter sp.]MBK9487881.1 N-acetyltransferase [Haliscomenobacter sp.]HOY18954.1 GNAT family N-acetyltransferase [Haliscomenobacter sp.]HPH19659.1 GNAT family N-acetyltransferase [Haliscomenobacter sp.]